MKNKNLLKDAIVSGKKAVVGLAAVVLTAVAGSVYAKNVADKEDKLVAQAQRDLEYEDQFMKSPYLYQKYNGRVDVYIKDARKQDAEYAAKKTKISNKDIAKIIAKRDKMLFENLCGKDGKVESNFEYNTEIDKNGKRHLVYAEGSFIGCEAESGYYEYFVFNREHCSPDRRVCRPEAFGADVVCGCHANNNLPQAEDNLSPILDWNNIDNVPSASLNKAQTQKLALIQSMLNVKEY